MKVLYIIERSTFPEPPPPFVLNLLGASKGSIDFLYNITLYTGDYMESGFLVSDIKETPRRLRNVLHSKTHDILTVESLLRKIGSKIERHGIKYSYHITLNLSAEGIDRFADESGYDLVITPGVQAKGVIGFRILSSTPQALARNVRIPLLVLPHNLQSARLKKPILFSVDFRETKAVLKVLERFRPFLLAMQVDLHFLHIAKDLNDSQESESEALFKEVLEQHGWNTDGLHIIEDEDIASAIWRFAQRNNIGQLVLATHGRHGLSRIFHSNITKKVLRHESLPVWIFDLE